MAEEETEEPEGATPEGVGLQDHMAHWVEVLDRWVRGFDQGIGADGRRSDGVPVDGGAGLAPGEEG